VSDALTSAFAFGLAFALAMVSVPVAIRTAWQIGFLDRPAGYKKHGRPTPYLGGAAVMVATVPAAVLLGGLDSKVAWILGGAVVLAVVGTVDDRRMLGPALRLLVEIAVGVALWAAGLGWSAFNSDVTSLLLTVVWIVGLVNAFNLMDNLDGATGTVGMVCAAGVGVAALLYGGIALAALAFALAGACAGFLVYNLGRPSRIFLGDGGSMPIGFVVAAVLMAVAWDDGGFGSTAIVAAAPLVGLPILDTTMVLVSRARRGARLFSGGRDHLTHRLLGPLGTPRLVAVALAAAQAGLCALGVFLLGAGSTWVIATGIGYIALGSLAIMVLDRSPRLRPDAPAMAERAAPQMVAQPAQQDLAP